MNTNNFQQVIINQNNEFKSHDTGAKIFHLVFI